MARVYKDNALNRKLGRVGLPYANEKGCPEYTIRNPKTGRCISIDSKVGKTLNKTSAIKSTPIKKREKKLLVCHGADSDQEEGWEDADTLDIRDEIHPTIVQDIARGKVDKKYIGKYAKIKMVYCTYFAYLHVENHNSFGERNKQQLVPIRNTFVNLNKLLNKGGTLIINNFSLYLDNIKTNKRGIKNKMDMFMETISDLFTVKDLEFKNREASLILRKKN